jgi:hypothetical protein
MADTPGSWGEAAAQRAAQMGILPAVIMTDEQAAEFRERFAEAMKDPTLRVLPRPDPLTQDEVRQLLRECVTVVKPGEVLVIRMGTDIPREVAHAYQTTLTEWLATHAPGVKVAIVCGDELGVAEAPPTGPFEPILPPHLDVDPGAGFLP